MCYPPLHSGAALRGTMTLNASTRTLTQSLPRCSALLSEDRNQYFLLQFGRQRVVDQSRPRLLHLAAAPYD